MASRFYTSLVFGISLLTVSWLVLPAQSQDAKGPIAYTGHGAFMDANGKRIIPTEKFIREALQWYASDAIERVPPEKRMVFEQQINAARKARPLNVNEELTLELKAADWLYENAKKLPSDDRKRAFLKKLEYVLKFELPKTDSENPYVSPIDLNRELFEDIRKFGFGEGNISILKSTLNAGQDYITECSNNGVPIPPPIGDAQWISQGFIPTNELFLANTIVEVMTFNSTSPVGMCIALPRSNQASGNLVVLDGVVCLGKAPSPLSGKSSVCFWDNQMGGNSFSFIKGTKIPIGWNDPAQVSPNPTGQFMSGGAELTSIGAGECTDCHAGQNPYIVHPRNPSPQLDASQPQNPPAETTLGKLGKAPLNLPMFGDTWYDPIVLGTWPQNEKRLNDVYLPAACQGCHNGGSAGRLPHLSTEITGYCGTVLAQAIQSSTPHSMPQFSPGSAANDVDVKAIADMVAPAFCGLGPAAGPSDRGDPHLVTTNNIAYDFQAAGEFVALQDGDASFELQTRQSPVLTTFTPGPNPYTGLASCVSLNTAVALKMGKSRVTYQSSFGTDSESSRMQLRVDGKIVTIKSGSISLGDGNFIKSNGGGSLTFGATDGTRVIVSPKFWDSQGYWYLDVEVIDTFARAGIMGHIANGEWLPRGGDGSNFGPKPALLDDRFDALNIKFANSWRVTDQTSLFDYVNGQSTKNFTDTDWPSKQLNCQKSSLNAPIVKEPTDAGKAKEVCAPIKDKNAREECIFDVQVLGEKGVLKAYLRSLKLRQAVQANKK